MTPKILWAVYDPMDAIPRFFTERQFAEQYLVRMKMVLDSEWAAQLTGPHEYMLKN